MRAYDDLIKSQLVPAFEKLLADGTVTSYGMDTEDFHTGKLCRVTFYFTTPDAAAFDKAEKSMDEAFDKNPALISAFQSMVDGQGHRDFLDRVGYIQQVIARRATQTERDLTQRVIEPNYEVAPGLRPGWPRQRHLYC